MTVVAPRTNRGPGLVDTGTQNIEAVLGAPAVAGTEYRLTAIMQAADIADPTLTIGFEMYLDGLLVRQGDWTCGTRDRHGNMMAPYFTYSMGGTPATTVRVTANLPRQVSFGLDVSLGTVI